MKLPHKIIYAFCLLIYLPLFAQKQIKLSSPNGDIVFHFKLTNKTAAYSVRFKSKVLVDYSTLGLQTSKGNFESNLTIGKASFRDTTEQYDLFTGKASHITAQYKEVTIPLTQNMAPFSTINIVVRAFDDGLAFRYEFPKQKENDSLILLDENSMFKLAGNPTVHALILPNYTSSHEGIYSNVALALLPADTLMDMPALFDFDGKAFMAITEAALLDYAGMYLSKHNGILTSKLSPLPKQTNLKVKAVLPHKSPWRVMMISDRIGALVESNMVTNLSEPCRLKDISWLKPGTTTFPWWNGNVVPDTINAPGNNFVTNQYYIDFCARNNITYHSVVEYGLHQWYTDDGVGFQPGPHADVTTPVPGLDMKEICDYAHSKGVGIRVWVQWAALYPKIDSAFAIFERWGISGMMIDFMDRDDQEMVNIQTEMLEKAAKHHMHIQFHGAYKPTGLNRTYPNEFTREGTLNYETDKWDPKGLSPDNDINIPFTRMLAGSTDYHLGGFRAVDQQSYRTQYTRPLVLGTRCHMMAMYVVLENYLQMVCDYPEAYEGQPGFDFIKTLPTTWDETKVLDAKIGHYITIARRKGHDWYIGTITNNEPRALHIPLSFLKDGNYTAEIYADDIGNSPNKLLQQTLEVNNKGSLDLKLAGGGGNVVRLRMK